MNDLVERMKSAKAKADEADYRTGSSLGTSWANRAPDAAALQRLDRLHDELNAQPQYDWDDFFDEQEASSYGVDEALFFALYPEADKDRRAARDFWEGVSGDSLQHAANRGAFLKGFAQGALDLWLSVKDEV